ncbi:hypothetical protein DPMN_066376 [Dreissena polymorpha]|uniref:Uncharacterized protein n=1 Tax=Dreissena polymorpha TaxID=45954 RepID=A0A9D4BS03_DREPO|nr:hypothetical protein DPMN_066376 [Dreissena polymorpha]
MLSPYLAPPKPKSQAFLTCLLQACRKLAKEACASLELDLRQACASMRKLADNSYLRACASLRFIKLAQA